MSDLVQVLFETVNIRTENLWGVAQFIQTIQTMKSKPVLLNNTD